MRAVGSAEALAAPVAVSCVVLVLNEYQNLPDLLRSVARADQIMIVDSGSSDGSVEIAESMGATVLSNPWPGYAAQRNWALNSPCLQHEWVLFVDADERITNVGWEEIRSFIQNPGKDVAADFRRSVWVFNRELKHGGFNTARVTRLLHRRHCSFTERPVHEHAAVLGTVRHLKVPIIHDDQKPFEAWLDRHNKYSSLEAIARLDPHPTQLSRLSKEWIRRNLWQHLPARPLLFFAYVYVIRAGFLDGKAGLRIALLYGFQELAIGIKVEEELSLRRRELPWSPVKSE